MLNENRIFKSIKDLCSWILFKASISSILMLLIYCNNETAQQLPTLIISKITDLKSTSATCVGKVTSDGGIYVIERGVCRSKGQTPTISDY